MTDDEFDSVLDVHLRGGFYVLRAAFPHMRKAGYGRVVLTGSINGLYGNQGAANYSVAKGGLHALANVVALEGAEHGIKANVILPAALTRMAEGLDTSAYPPMEPEQVAPAVGWLCHETCSLSGEMLISAAGRLARAFVAESPGTYRPDWTIEAIGEQMESIRSTESPVIFPVLPSGQLEHLRYSFAMATELDKK
jgi:NAD(P)-dependent dehydrogenase (short-subunit alcohol dehydrogenase family)